ADETARDPAEAERPVGDERRAARGRERADDAERDDRAAGAPEAAPADREPAVEEDHDQRDRRDAFDGADRDRERREEVGGDGGRDQERRRRRDEEALAQLRRQERRRERARDDEDREAERSQLVQGDVRAPSWTATKTASSAIGDAGAAEPRKRDVAGAEGMGGSSPTSLPGTPAGQVSGSLKNSLLFGHCRHTWAGHSFLADVAVDPDPARVSPLRACGARRPACRRRRLAGRLRRQRAGDHGQGSGLVFGHIQQGTLAVQSYDAADTYAPQISGASGRVVGNAVVYSGSDIRFLLPNGRFSIRIDGTGIDISAVGKGTVVAIGLGTADDGTLSVNSGAAQ